MTTFNEDLLKLLTSPYFWAAFVFMFLLIKLAIANYRAFDNLESYDDNTDEEV